MEGLADMSVAGRTRIRRRDCQGENLSCVVSAGDDDTRGCRSLLGGIIADPLPFLPEAPGENPRSFLIGWWRNYGVVSFLKAPPLESMDRLSIGGCVAAATVASVGGEVGFGMAIFSGRSVS